jgi:hypothetical protein
MGWVVSVTPWPLFSSWEGTPGTHWIGGWVRLRASLDSEARRKILYLCRGSNPDRPVVQSVVRHCADWAIPAPNFTPYNYQSTSCTWCLLSSVLLRECAAPGGNVMKQQWLVSIQNSNLASPFSLLALKRKVRLMRSSCCFSVCPPQITFKPLSRLSWNRAGRSWH